MRAGVIVPVMLVQCDDMWGRDCLAYNLQIRLEAQVVTELVAIQARIASELPLRTRAVPRHALHTSVYALIPVDWHDASKEERWQKFAVEAQAELSRICHQTAPFRMSFVGLRVTPKAIVAVAEPVAAIAALRETFARLTDAFNVPHIAYDLVHTTIARYAETTTFALPSTSLLEPFNTPITAHIDAIFLVRERVYPSLTVDTLAKAPLGG